MKLKSIFGYGCELGNGCHELCARALLEAVRSVAPVPQPATFLSLSTGDGRAEKLAASRLVEAGYGPVTVIAFDPERGQFLSFKNYMAVRRETFDPKTMTVTLSGGRVVPAITGVPFGKDASIYYFSDDLSFSAYTNWFCDTHKGVVHAAMSVNSVLGGTAVLSACLKLANTLRGTMFVFTENEETPTVVPFKQAMEDAIVRYPTGPYKVVARIS